MEPDDGLTIPSRPAEANVGETGRMASGMPASCPRHKTNRRHRADAAGAANEGDPVARGSRRCPRGVRGRAMRRKVQPDAGLPCCFGLTLAAGAPAGLAARAAGGGALRT